MSPRLSVGVAIAADCLSATWRAQRRTVDWNTTFTHGGGGGRPSLEILRLAFADLRAQLSLDARVSVAVAILPPLARLRRIELPPMTDDDRRLAVSRTAERYFLGLPESVVCAVERRKGEGAAVPFLAAAVSSSFVNDLLQAVGELGWVIDRFVPAHSAWMAAAKGRWAELRRGDGMLVILGNDETSALVVRGGKMSIARRLRSGETSLGVASSGESAQSTFFIGGHDGRSPAVIAAEAAERTRSLEFVPDSELRARLIVQIRVSRLLMGVAAACVLASAGAYRRGLSHQLEAITSQRNALRARVTQAVTTRDTLADLAGSINAIRVLERSAPRWSAVLARIAVALPRDASLIGLRADGDSVNLEGQASNASAAIGALRSAPSVIGVRSTAPIRQDLTADKGSVERWTLALRVAHDAAVLSGR
jgi:hypothetical protein